MIEGIKLTAAERKRYKDRETLETARILADEKYKYDELPYIWLKDGKPYLRLGEEGYELVTPMKLTVSFRGHRRKNRDYIEWPETIMAHNFYYRRPMVTYEMAIRYIQVMEGKTEHGVMVYFPAVVEFTSPKGKARYARLSATKEFAVLVSSEGTVK